MHVNKPPFEQFRHALAKAGRPMRERDVVPIEQAIVAALESFPDLLVEKIRRNPNSASLGAGEHFMLEISAHWLGLAADPHDVVRTLKHGWHEEALGAEAAKFHVVATDTAVVLTFAGAYPESQFLTGRVRVVF